MTGINLGNYFFNMKYLKLFEDFTEFINDPLIKWPDAPFWILKLHPEEICYLAMYSDGLKNKSNRTKEEYPIPISGDRRSGDLELNEDGGVSFEMYYSIPTKNDEVTFSFEVDGRGGFTKYSPATYYDPEEGGETILDSIEILNPYYIDDENNIEIFFEKYTFKSDIITKNDFYGMMEAISDSKIISSESEIDDSFLSKYPIINKNENSPIYKLYKKCEEIRKNDPDLKSIIKGSSVARRFNI